MKNAILAEGNLSLLNGTLTVNNNYLYAVYVKSENNIEIENTIIDTVGSGSYGICLSPTSGSAILAITNSSLLINGTSLLISKDAASQISIKDSIIGSEATAQSYGINIVATADSPSIRIENSTVYNKTKNYGAINAAGSVQLTIENSVIENKNEASNGTGYALSSSKDGTQITITGPNAKLLSHGTNYSLKLSKGAIIIDNGTYTGNISKTGGTITIYGGKFSADVSSYCTPASDYDLTSSVSIDDIYHTIVRYSKTPLILTDSYIKVDLNGNGAVLPEISDLFSGIPGAINWTIPESAAAILTISNGRIYATAPSDDDITVTATVGQSECEVKVHVADYVCAIGDVGYESLADAFSAAQSGDTIKVLRSHKMFDGAKLGIGKTITLDLDGYVVTWAKENSENDIMIDVYGYLTITGNGTFNTQSGIDHLGIVLDSTAGAICKIMSGTFDINSSEVCYIIGPSYSNKAATLEILGGSFKGKLSSNTNDYRYTINSYDSVYASGKANILIKGGSFYQFNPQNNLAEGSGTCFTPEGYHSAYNENTGYYTVVSD